VVLIEDLTVHAIGADSLYLTFTPIAVNGEDLDAWDLYVQRSEINTPSGLYWTTIATISGSCTDYTDTSISGVNFNQFRDIWYRLQPSGFDACDHDAIAYDPDKYALEIIRREAIALRADYAGQPICVLRKRTLEPTRCTSCWDAILRRVNDPDCPDCYGTGFVSGYYSAISGLATITAASRVKQMTQFGEFDQSYKVLYMGPYPFIYPRDIFEDQMGRRWRINKVNTVEKNGQIINQSAQVSEIDREDIVYTIDIP